MSRVRNSSQNCGPPLRGELLCSFRPLVLSSRGASRPSRPPGDSPPEAIRPANCLVCRRHFFGHLRTRHTSSTTSAGRFSASRRALFLLWTLEGNIFRFGPPGPPNRKMRSRLPPTSRPPILPVKSRRFSARAPPHDSSPTRSSPRPSDATEASASDLRRGSQDVLNP